MNLVRTGLLALLAVLMAACEELGPESRGEISNTAVQSVAERRTCLPLFDVERVRPVDPSTVEFVLRDGTVWRNALQQSCQAITSRSVLAVGTETDSACAADQLLVLQQLRGLLRHSETCVLGSFDKI